MNATKPTLIVIAGPTAVGKTVVAIQLAQHFETEIISADSRQCYHGMEIGTAQPTAKERKQIKHHFVDRYPPETALSAADFERFALAQLSLIFETKKVAILCGGTGLYIKALCEGLDEMPSIDEKINAEINAEYTEKGIDWLQEKIKIEDQIFFATGEKENPARLIRALVFKLSSGKSITDFKKGIKKERPFRIIKIGLELPREILYQRINNRVLKMMEEGLLAEVAALFPLRHLKNLNTVGYSEIFDFLEEKTSLETAIEKIQQHSRNYAKRQLTWFRKDEEFVWMRADDENLKAKIEAII